MKKIKILLSMIYPYLILTYLMFSDTVKISSEWDFMLSLTQVILFVMFLSGLVAFFVCLIKDFVQWCKAKKETKRK